jgi:hypothetical protein
MAIKIVFLEENKKMQAVHCTKYLPAAGRPADARNKFAPLLHSSIGVQHSTLV